MEEEWRIIKDYPNYSVSNFGNVRNNKTQRILKPQSHKNGEYLGVDLGRNRNLVHRLVAFAFLEKQEEHTDVDHIDHNGTNNHISNLRWATRSQNQYHMRKKSNCTSKYIGVSFHKHSNKWRCCKRISGKTKHIGHYNTQEEAGLAYNQYIIDNNLGEFCELNIL